jgi:hypothetical protein
VDACAIFRWAEMSSGILPMMRVPETGSSPYGELPLVLDDQKSRSGFTRGRADFLLPGSYHQDLPECVI